jgi:hypothetical protein
MRSLGLVLLVGGIFGFVYSGDELKKHDPVPEGLSMSQSLEYPAGRWEIGRYACAAGAGLGLLLAMFPKGR